MLRGLFYKVSDTEPILPSFYGNINYSMFPGFEHPMERFDSRFTKSFVHFLRFLQSTDYIFSAPELSEKDLRAAFETTNLLEKLRSDQSRIEVSGREFKYDSKGGFACLECLPKSILGEPVNMDRQI